MASLAQPQPRYYTPEEYLAFERGTDFKSEYLDGQIYAMAGSSPEHSTITVNISGQIYAQLRGKTCQAFSNDMKVCTSPDGLFAYPDLSVVCGQPQFHDAHKDVLINPILLIEVLSPSTEAFDRGKKFARYQEIPTLTDYLLITQDEPRMDHYVRYAQDQWLLTTVHGLDAKLYLASIDCTLLLADVYERVQFPQKPGQNQSASS